ncbi:MAG: hypothetical protein KBD37_00825 [Burkholderiales bacterium]|nr:hypothetical protein [Burkholderiales bacterium]
MHQFEEIAQETGISRNTIRKVLRNDETNHKYQREVIHKPKLGEFEDELREEPWSDCSRYNGLLGVQYA